MTDLDGGPGDAGDSLDAWTRRYLDLAVRGVRSDEVTGKITRHLDRFTAWFTSGYGHDRVSAVTPGVSVVLGKFPTDTPDLASESV